MASTRAAAGSSSPEAQARFNALQQKLVPLWTSIRALNEDPQTIVVVPSMAMEVDLRGSEVQAYEERFLFLLLLLRQPRARLVYVTGQAIHPSIVDYYLDLMPGVISSHARRRLFLVSPLDASPRPLATKLLERPRLLERLRALVPDPDRAHLVPFATTWADRELALRLGIPMYGCDPALVSLGTKSSSRRLFREAGVPHPAGREDLGSEDALVDAIVSMRRENPALRRVVIKLNEGVSGTGNSNLDLSSLPPPGSAGERDGVRRLLPSMTFELQGLAYPVFLERLAEQQGIVEERIVAEEVRSPSVQLRVTPLGELELLSTHDQLLGGVSGQSYLGCRFPADAAYAGMISREAAKVGRRLASAGVLGRFALDFVVARSKGGSWAPYAIEINLRKGGTTHPFLTLRFLTDGDYDPSTGEFLSQTGTPKCYFASDSLKSDRYRGLLPEDLIDISVYHGLHFHGATERGVVFHLMGALSEFGKLGLVCIGDNLQQARFLHRRTTQVLDEETSGAER